jgi:dihydrofolate reductase
MANLIFSMTASLDGFIAAPGGDIGWSAPDEELHRFHNERTRAQGVYFCGRRLYEEMLGWEAEPSPDAPGFVHEFARIWQALPKVVFSRTLETVQGNARLATGTPAEEVARARGETDEDLGVGGAELAAAFMQHDLVDEYQLFVSPILLGAGTPYFPALESRQELELAETRTFGGSIVFLRYRRLRAV